MSGGDFDLEFEKRVVDLFRRALELPADRVAAYVAEAAGDDAALRRRVQRLLELGGDTTDTSVLPSLPALAVETPELAPGARVGPFTVDGRLGQGGMGVVYAATQDHPRRTVALKVLRRPLSYARFASEVEIQARLHHPRIAQVFLSGQDQAEDGCELHYFAMEQIAGARSITEFGELHDEPLAVRLDRFAEVCDAVDYAHRNGVIHRDLKPSNILVDSDGAPKVIDFGIARLLEEGAGATPAYTGTPEYMAPEQRERGVSDSRSDVYALGRVLGKQLHDPVPVDLQWIVAKATSTVPTARYATPAELARDLRRFRAGEAVQAGEGRLWYRAKKYARRHRLRVALVSGAVIAGTVLGGLWALYARDATARIDRLRAVQVLHTLNDRALRLSPSVPENIDGFEAWLKDAEELIAGLDDHRQALRAIEARALPQTEAERRRDRATHPQAELLTYAVGDLALKREQLAVLEGAHGQGGGSASPALAERFTLAMRAARGQITELEESIPRLEAEVAARTTWRFASVQDAWWHQQLTSLCRDIESFVDAETGVFPDVRRRLEFARTVGGRTLEGRAAELWEGAARAIADHPAYGGLHLTPQVGLLPLGPDPASGLWEFAHLESGEAPDRDPHDGALHLEPGHGIVLVLLPGGEPWIGANASENGARHVDPAAGMVESPPHQVPLDPFFLAKHEMTQAQWRRLAGTNPSGQAAGHPLISKLHPVEGISWDSAAQMMRRLGLDLPTEAQWEYAARAGSGTPWWTGREIESLRGAVNFVDLAAKRHKLSWAEVLPWADLDDGYPMHAPVDTLKPNPFGLHHVHGNVMEWCADGFRNYAQPGQPERTAPGTGALLGGDPRRRAARGGSHLHGPSTARSSHRVFHAPSFKSMDLGVRPARSIQRD